MQTSLRSCSIAIAFILSQIRVSISVLPKTAILFKNLEGGRAKVDILTELRTYAEGVLVVDLGALYFLQSVVIEVYTIAPGADQMILETQFHRVVKSLPRRHLGKRIGADAISFKCGLLCRLLRFLGNFKVRTLNINGYATYQDANLGCYSNESSSTNYFYPESAEQLNLCLGRCAELGYAVIFYNQNASPRCQCDASIDVREKVSPKLCNGTCDKDSYVCGGSAHYSGYSLRIPTTDYDNASVWDCLFDPTYCQECPATDGVVCNIEDQDECSTPDICGPHSKCINVPWTYYCKCTIGYAPDPINNICTDVNECAEGSSTCTNGECKNTVGSYECDCYAGFESKRLDCVDIDECATECTYNYMECRNTLGSYECFCKKGYEEMSMECDEMDTSGEEESDTNTKTNKPTFMDNIFRSSVVKLIILTILFILLMTFFACIIFFWLKAKRTQTVSV